MKKHYITRSAFDAIFEDCMQCDEVPFADGTTEKDNPRMIIRDLDIDTSEMQESGVWDSDGDKEFFIGDLDKAWEYFNSCDRVRVMDLCGSIYIDAYGDEQ